MLNKYVNDLDKIGVAVVKSVYKYDEIIALQKLANQTHQKVLESISKNPKYKEYKYYTHFDKERCSIKKNYKIENLDILEIVKGRYDINCELFSKSVNTKIMDIINSFISKQYSITCGLLTSDVNSNNGPWHRDVINIDGESDKLGNYNDLNMVHNFQPFYFTILIPLVDLNATNGTPEFIEGSHKLTYRESLKSKHLRFNTELGDVIIFDGRIFHRGCENNSNKPRPVLYNVIKRNWYVETGE